MLHKLLFTAMFVFCILITSTQGWAETYTNVKGITVIEYCSDGGDLDCSTICTTDGGYNTGPKIYFSGYMQYYGDIIGYMKAWTAIDGTDLENCLLPTNSFYRFGVWFQNPWGYMFCYDVYYRCPSDKPCGIDYVVGPVEGIYDADGFSHTFFVDVPAEAATSMPFQFEFCNTRGLIGSGCNVSNSIGQRWVLHTPAPVKANSIAGGDAPPVSFSGTGVTVDFQNSSGGIVTATNVPENPPGTPPMSNVLPRYWEIKTDMQGDYLLDLLIAYDPAEVMSADEENLKVFKYDEAAGTWIHLATSINPESHTALVSNLTSLSIFAIAELQEVPVEETTWGAIKANYAGDN